MSKNFVDEQIGGGHTLSEEIARECSRYDRPVLNEREATHGDYSVTATLSQTLKLWFRKQPGWDKLRGVQQESLDLIAVKVSRILSGSPSEIDHWKDIAGYADLIVARLKL